ncbi:hypothetical protein BC834DRAFT_970906 [Gloeopeniophorella convolvens]|nr:hypothetical protein BC834DRAFT_970906 [Gloeopeniophorella convolvens]
MHFSSPYSNQPFLLPFREDPAEHYLDTISLPEDSDEDFDDVKSSYARDYIASHARQESQMENTTTNSTPHEFNRLQLVEANARPKPAVPGSLVLPPNGPEPEPAGAPHWPTTSMLVLPKTPPRPTFSPSVEGASNSGSRTPKLSSEWDNHDGSVFTPCSKWDCRHPECRDSRNSRPAPVSPGSPTPSGPVRARAHRGDQ